MRLFIFLFSLLLLSPFSFQSQGRGLFDFDFGGGGGEAKPQQEGFVIKDYPPRLSEGQSMRADTRSLSPQGAPIPQRGRANELAPVYSPVVGGPPASRGFEDKRFIPGGGRGMQGPHGRANYWQGVYWPYRYRPYERGAYWPYRFWPHENDVYWQGSNWPYTQRADTGVVYNQGKGAAVSLTPSTGNSGKTFEPLNDEGFAELDMWRKAGTKPVEVQFYGKEALIKWGDSSSRVPVPENGKIQINLKPTK